MRAKVGKLEERLSESEGTLKAILSGEVDAILVSTPEGERIFTLKGAEEPYRVLFEQMSEGAVTVSHDGIILFCNQSFADMMKAPLENIIGINLETFLCPSEVYSYRELIEQSIDRPARGDLSFKAADGTMVPEHLSVSYLPTAGEPMHCIVLADLSEHIRAEEALRKAYGELDEKVQERTRELSESEQRFRVLIQSSSQAVWETDASGKVIADSPSWRTYTGQTLEEWMGYGWVDAAHPDDRGYAERHWREALSAGSDMNAEFRLRGPDGGWRWTNVRAAPIRDEEGRIVKWVGMNLDITARKRGEEELRRSNEELQQFAYVASHDLQEPLRMVTMYLALLSKRYSRELSPQAQEYMGSAVEGSLRMKELIGDLLQYSRLDAQPMELKEVDMNDLTAQVLETLRATIEEAGAEVMVGPLPVVRADEQQIAQILQNLVSNAIKFLSDREPRVEVSSITFDNEYVFSVKDNGIGIDPKYQDKLFKMFSRLHTREEYPGTGIGLAISKKIVERHGGRIWFESEPGKGTTFFFTIPT
ncbi:MAG: PAS domain S-box protein [Methanomassiliicoccus sp.]|nr:PAS domain S-box protein [Methanomassiliicoccus sp.]